VLQEETEAIVAYLEDLAEEARVVAEEPKFSTGGVLGAVTEQGPALVKRSATRAGKQIQEKSTLTRLLIFPVWTTSETGEHPKLYSSEEDNLNPEQ
jgi:hypothetical protein